MLKIKSTCSFICNGLYKTSSSLAILIHKIKKNVALANLNAKN